MDLLRFFQVALAEPPDAQMNNTLLQDSQADRASNETAKPFESDRQDVLQQAHMVQDSQRRAEEEAEPSHKAGAARAEEEAQQVGLPQQAELRDSASQAAGSAQAIERLQAEAHSVQQQLADCTAGAEAAEQALAQVQQQLAATAAELAVRAAAAEGALAEVQRQAGDAAAQASNAQQWRDKAEHAQAKLVDNLRSQQAALTAGVNAQTARAEEAEQARQLAQGRAKVAEGRAAAAERALQSLQVQLQDAEQQFEQLRLQSSSMGTLTQAASDGDAQKRLDHFTQQVQQLLARKAAVPGRVSCLSMLY